MVFIFNTSIYCWGAQGNFIMAYTFIEIWGGVGGITVPRHDEAKVVVCLSLSYEISHELCGAKWYEY